MLVLGCCTCTGGTRKPGILNDLKIFICKVLYLFTKLSPASVRIMFELLKVFNIFRNTRGNKGISLHKVNKLVFKCFETLIKQLFVFYTTKKDFSVIREFKVPSGFTLLLTLLR